VNLAQQGLSVGGGVGSVDEGNTGHGDFLRLRVRDWTMTSS
jgi:hypothetical protein